ncbi:MAG: carbohydrate binding family 9 domain-containing protein [Gemmatimonadetes bacterium]|nr:carbohydrate binding family 9 domain-containing protein [Gemmatimonadota bacterium]
MLLFGLVAHSAAVYAQAQTSRRGDDAVRPINPETEPRPEWRAVRASGPISIDATLVEPAWKEAEPITRFVQSEPHTGHPPTERSEVRILYDDRSLYVGAMLHDSDIRRLMYAGAEQDFDAMDGDLFSLMLDPFLDRRSGFVFSIDPSGAVRDMHVFDDGRRTNLAWDGVVHVKTAVTDSAWIVELAVPFTTLRFDPRRSERPWGLNIVRRIRRKNESVYWAPLERRHRVIRVSRAGTLAGLEGIRQGRNLTVKPFVLAAQESGSLRAADGTEARLDAGVDLKYGLTPGLTLDLTYRTDFSQVEVDQERVNLTRFPLFFPEQREFFLENAGIFAFEEVTGENFRSRASARDFTLFHSRRLGLTSDGRPIPMLGGGKVAGRLGHYDVGVLHMRADAAYGKPAEGFSMARVRANLAENVDVGAMLIDRRASSDPETYSQSYGVDANARLFDRLYINSYYAGSAAPESAADGTAAWLSLGWRDRFWDVSAMAKRVGAHFEPTVGFVRRRALRNFYGTFGLHPRPSVSWLQELNPYVEVDYLTDLRSVLESRTVNLGFAALFLDGGTLTLEYGDRFERLTEAFRVFPGVTIPPGAYAFRDATAGYQIGRGHRVTGDVQLAAGEFFDGTRRSVGFGTLWRPRYNLFVELSLDHNDVDLPEGSFTADAMAGRVRYAFSPNLFGSAYMQYNKQTEQLVSSLRVTLFHAPLSNVFLVYTERRDMAERGVLERLLTFKVTKLLAF